jgi:hypothetical protein
MHDWRKGLEPCKGLIPPHRILIAKVPCSLCRPLKDRGFVITCLFYGFEDVGSGCVQQLLLGNLIQNVERAPSPGAFLQRADIQDPVAEVIVHFPVRSFPQERLVRMNTISSKQSSLRLWYEFLDICQQIISCLFWCRFRSNDFRCQTALAMCFRTPFILIRCQPSFAHCNKVGKTYHLIHSLSRIVNHCAPSFLIYNV